MRCPACGFITFDHLPACKRCGKSFPSRGEFRNRVTITQVAAPALLRSEDEVGADRGPEVSMGLPEPGVIRAGSLAHAPSADREGEMPAMPGVGAPSWPAESPARHGGQPEDRVESLGSTALLGDPDFLPKAGFWIRALAFLVDLALLALLTSAATVLVHAAAWVGGILGSTPDFALESIQTMAAALLAVLILACYFILFVGWRGQTPGKRLLALKVIRVTGEEVGYAWALVRWIGQGLSGLICGIGFLMVGFSRRKQGLHDKLAGTYVIRLPPEA